MEQILAKLIKNKIPVCLLFSVIFICGIMAFRSLPIDAFPDLTNNQVQILTDTLGMSPTESEQLVTMPIESMMNGIPNVVQIRSVSKVGLSLVTVVFKDNVDIYFARQLVNERLQSAIGKLPEGVSPEMGPITTGMGEIYQYAIEGKGYSPDELKTLHDWDIKYQLRTVPGVNEVNTWGGKTREYQVVLYPEKLLAYNLSLKQVFDSLKNNNANFSGGIIEHSSEQYIVSGQGLINSLEDIENIVVAYRDGTPIFIRNIAKVQYGEMFRQGAATKDGKGEVVTGIVMMLKGENSRNVIKQVKSKMEEIKKSLPEGVKIKPFYDQTNLVEQTIKTVKTNLVEGGMLVVLVLLLMLGNIRAALIVAFTIPMSLMFSFIGMKALGISANIMSLGAIDFGMIVDGSIVMTENIIHRLGEQQGKMSKLEIIENAVKEMAKPIFFGVLIITVVYMPVLTLEGMEYKMFSPMVFTVCFALLGSLMVAMFLTPVLCSIFLKNDNKDKPSVIVNKVRKPYNDFLEVVMKHRLKTVLVAITLFVVSVFSLSFKGTEFIPSLDEGCFSIGIADLPSISLSEAVKTTTLVEKTLKENIPEVKEVVSKIGRADLATDPMGVYETDMYVNLIPKSKWRFGMNKEKIGIEMDKVLLDKVPGVNFSFTQPIEMRVNELVSGVKSDIAIKLFGEDLDILTKKAEQIESVLQNVKGAVDIQVEQLSGQNQLSIIPDRLAIARYGIDIDDIKTLVTTATMGESVSEILDGKKRFALRVKFSESCRNNDVEFLKHLLVDTEDGRKVPLGQVATVKIDSGIEAVNREFGERRIIIQCNVRGRDIGSFVKDAQSKIDEKIKLPPSYYIQWGGQFENQERAMAKFAVVVPISIAIIFLLLLGTFSSVRDAVLVMFNVPFAAVGGIAALWIRGMYISVPAIIGFIALFGVAILNGLVLISTFNKLQAEGHSMHDVIRLGTATRLRPVLMTAMVAALGFLPMAISTGSGAEVQKPLATVIIGGLISSLFLTLIVLPVLYSLFGDNKVDLKKKMRRIFYKVKTKK